MFHQDTNDKAQALMPRTKHKRDFNSLTVLKGKKLKFSKKNESFYLKNFVNTTYTFLSSTHA